MVEALGAPGGPRPAERAAMVGRLHGGAPLVGELGAAGGVWLPSVDVELFVAGAESGRLPATCRRLAAYHETVARLTGRALLATLYPLAVVHLGAFALPLRQLVLVSVWAYFGRVLAVLGPLWLALAVAVLVLGRYSGVRRRVFACLPWVAGYQRARELGVLAMTLEGFASNGVSPVVAWERAGRATGAPVLEALGRRLSAEAEAGRQPGVALLQERAVPVEFAQAYRAGERSGRLDESLGWLARRYEEEAQRKLGLVALWYPQFALVGVAVWVAVNVVSMYAEYLRTLLELME